MKREAELIDAPDALRRLVQTLSQEQLIGIDTESNSLYAYYEQVCLIQISTRAEDFLVDPLALDDLSPLAPLMSDSAIEKVFHAATYDIACLKRDFGWSFANLFDTMMAARILGWKKIGLGKLLRQEFGVQVNKRHQRANWGRRPLPRDLLRYAQIDTHYLPPLRDKLADALHAGGHWEEAQEIFDDLTEVPAAEYTFDPEGFWRVDKKNRVPRRKMALVRELYMLRDQIARRQDQPVFKIFGNRTIVELALQAPQTHEDLYPIHGMSGYQVRRYGDAILQALRRGEQSEPPSLPPRPEQPPPPVLARYDALRNWRRERGTRRGVESDVILSRDTLWELAREAPRTYEDLKDIDTLGPWKRSTYGQEILGVLQRVSR